MKCVSAITLRALWHYFCSLREKWHKSGGSLWPFTMGIACHGYPVTRAPFYCADTKSGLVRGCAAGGHLLCDAWGVRLQKRVLPAFHTVHVFLHEQDKDWNGLYVSIWVFKTI